MPSIELSSPDKKTIQQFFDQIAGRYDFINSILSLRLDKMWRRRSRDLVLEGAERSVLDLGIGTGKFLSLFLDKVSWRKAVGLDFSLEMLSEARQKLPAEVSLVSADFHSLPFRKESFDLIISSFTLRSVKEMPVFLTEVYRMLRSRGKAAFLCLTRPHNHLLKFLYYPYLRYYLPLAGRLFSGNPGAYRFLSESIQSFQSPEETGKTMREIGFGEVQIYPFTGGAATLIVGRK